MFRGPFGRQDRLIVEKRHDAYVEWGKQPRDTMCRTCGAMYMNGRWTWNEPPVNVHPAICPACQRIADNYPAGSLDLAGAFLDRHRGEITNLIHNVETAEKSEHPLERIIQISIEDAQTQITTTGVHLARRIGEALSHAYQGELSFEYGDAETSIRMHWLRND